MNTQDLYLRFVSGGGWDSKIIEWYSDSPWSHVEILLYPGDSTFGAQFFGGVKKRSINDACYAKVARVEEWRIPLTLEQRALLDKLMKDMDGAHYAWRDIIAFAWGNEKHNLYNKNGEWICSGADAGIISSLGLARLDRPAEQYKPSDIHALVVNIPGAVRN